MTHFIGLDVSNKDTKVCIVKKGKVVKRFSVASDPDSIGEAIKKINLDIQKIGLEAGCLSHWIMDGLLKQGLNVVCLETRRMAAIIKTNINKTDKNDAKEIAIAVENGNYREVHHKSEDSINIKVMMSARSAIVHQLTNFKGTVRGLLKIYGIKLKPTLSNHNFVDEVLGQLKWGDFTPEEIKPKTDFSPVKDLLDIIQVLIEKLNKLDNEVEEISKKYAIVQKFMTVDGVGPITALSYMTNIDDPKRFKYSRSVGAYVGCTPKQYSSGESVIQGGISKCGPKDLRTLLYEAGMSILTRTKKWSRLKAWGLKIERKKGTKAAAVAIGRKLAIIMHRMWMENTEFCYGDPKSKQEKKDKDLLEKFGKQPRESKKEKKAKIAREERFINKAA